MATAAQVRIVVISILFSAFMFLAFALYFLLIAGNLMLGIVLLVVFASEMVATFVVARILGSRRS